MMFGRVQYQQWDPGIAWFHLTWSSSLVVGLRKENQPLVSSVPVSYVGDILRDGFNFHMLGFHGTVIIDISHHACVGIIWDPGIIFGLIGFNCGGNKKHWRFIHHLRK